MTTERVSDLLAAQAKASGKAARAKFDAKVESRRLADASARLPHELLLDWARDDGLDVPTRIDCAKAAAPYYAPRLQAIATQVSGSIDVATLDDAALLARLASLGADVSALLSAPPMYPTVHCDAECLSTDNDNAI